MSDALDRIRQRTKPKVAPRDSSLISPASQHPDIQTSRHIDTSTPAPQADNSGQVDALKSRHTDIQTPKSPDDDFSTKRSTFRLEASLIDRLHTRCRRHGLSREVLIEAMYDYMEDHPEAMEQVMTLAQEKHEQRLQLANRKRAEAMFRKFGDS